MDTFCLPYDKTSIQRPLTHDYLKGKDHLNTFYAYTPDLKGTEQAVQDRSDYPVDRELLVQVLSEQYQELDPSYLTKKANQAVAQNIQALAKETTFTVTTGHQLNILGGPLFYFYKIASTIHLANQLHTQFPNHHFVPVYWMGSEDHDFHEINHIHLFGETYTWEKPGEGSVGNLDPSTLSPLVESIQANIREQEAFKPLADLWEYAFNHFDTYARASQYWLDKVFRDYGLVILDPADKRLKQKMAPVFKEDAIHHTHQSIVEKYQSELKHYDLPVNPRPINLFYSGEGLRERIIQNGEGYKGIDTGITFTPDELKRQIEEQPENFSPNVVLRPLYQQMVLPNLAYIGGTNEIAYWLELKGVFDHHRVFFPQLLVRKSIFWLGKGVQKKMKKFGIKAEDLFRPVDDVVREYVAEKEDTTPFDEKIQTLRNEYESLMSLCNEYEDEMKWPIVNLAKQHLKDLEKLQKDTRKLIKQRNEKDIQQIHKVFDALFPEGISQERYENFIPYYTRFGQEFFDRVIRDSNPLEQEMVIYQD